MERFVNYTLISPLSGGILPALDEIKKLNLRTDPEDGPRQTTLQLRLEGL